VIKLIPFNNNDWQLNSPEYNDMLVVENPKAIIISHISNVTGYELPYDEIFSKAKKYDIVTVLDSAQGFGTDYVNTKHVDYLVFAGHKALYSVFGVAGIIAFTDQKLIISKAGGTGSDSLNPNMPDELPNRLEAGSLNSVAIYALNKSIDFINNSNFSNIKQKLTTYLLDELRKIKNVIIYCPQNVITKGIVSFNIEGFTSDEIGKILSSKYDICVRTGYHCAPYVHDFIGDKKFAGCVRVSFSGFNTISEIDTLIQAIKEIMS
jgi:selenocysteine lyase/cysteine desulfurase